MTSSGHSHGESSISLDQIHFPDHHHDEDEPDGVGDPSQEPEEYWDVENVQLDTVGIDIGSSTSHLMFARVHMQRLAQGLSSRFVVVDRKVVWRSPVVLTPYLPDNSIDADVLGKFVQECYVEAGVERTSIDTGAVVLTGEALKRRNARAIADLFATETGTFVCASAGHHLEAAMAAHGSGAVADSREDPRVRLHVDVGGGTAKLALIADGAILGTAAVAVGGRLVALDGRRVVRVEGPALEVAQAAGIPLALGEELSEGDEQRLVRSFVDVLVGCIDEGGVPASYPADLLLVDDRPPSARPQVVSFSGGVAEYFYGRESQTFGDVAPSLAAELRAAFDAGRLDMEVVEARAHIRATVIGASQFSVQVSGNTVGLSGADILPVRNLPVLFPRVSLEGDFEPAAVADAVAAAARRFDVEDAGQPVAVALHWSGDPEYRRLRALAEGLVAGLAEHLAAGHPLVVLLDGDLARSLGRLLTEELGVQQPVVCLDGVRLEEFDYVDIGELIRPAGVVPVIIKSLLFDAPPQAVSGSGVLARGTESVGSRHG
ncbi:MAG: ethanolamine utilization protein EutA [Actinomycetota bacterium]|nr:ethanolamine utilization protein EutA [Actinomycetota bacterium]